VIRKKCFCIVYLPLLSVFFATEVFSADWPTYQHDNRRSGVTAERLEPPLTEQWVFKSTHAPVPAWGDPSPKPIEGNLELPRLRFDDAFHVAAVGGSVYFGSSVDNTIYALDAASGRLRWSVYTDGPVRLAPTIRQGKLYAGSDDGFVYCLKASDGSVIWKFKAAPHPDKVLGNGRLISLWPVRTSVLVDKGVAYFAAGVFPSEGLSLYAVDAATGELIWKNDAYGRGGLGEMSPQGYLLASASRLFVPSGRCAPGAFDRTNGMELYQPKPSWRRDGLFGGTYALLSDDYLFNGTERIIAYTPSTGRLSHAYEGRRLVIVKDRAYLMTGKEIVSLDRKTYPTIARRNQALKAKLSSRARLRRSLAANKAALTKLRPTTPAQSRPAADVKKLKKLTKTIAALQDQLVAMAAEEKEIEKLMTEAPQWRFPFADSDALILAGDALFAGGKDRVVAIEATTGSKLWTGQVRGRSRGLAVANGRLLVSTDKGDIHCFARTAMAAPVAPPPADDPVTSSDDGLGAFYTQTAERIVNESAIKRGYCLILGGDVRLATGLAERTDVLIHMVEPDARKVASARKTLTAAGRYGARVSVEHRPLSGLVYPDYFADLIVCGDSLLSGTPATPPEEVLRMLKPHGGVVCVGQPPWARDLAKPVTAERLQQWLAGVRDESTEVKITGTTWARVTRGGLPGADNWTHQYADPGNTACSNDQLVKGPLGILWFGEPGPKRMVNRHASSVAPLSVNGRMFIQGENLIMAYDAYNGWPLWEREIAGALRLHMRIHTDSSNLAASNDSLFVAAGGQCLRLDVATGETRQTYAVPTEEGDESSRWGYLARVGHTLFGSRTAKGMVSNRLFALDIETGQQKWTYSGGQMAHDSIAIGDGRVYLVDSVVTDEQQQRVLAESHSGAVGRKGKPDVRLVVALDAATGKPVWTRPIDVSDCVKIASGGGELSAIYARNVLLLCAAPWNGHFWQEFFAGKFSRRSIIALSGDSGQPLWSDHLGYRSRPLVVGDTIYAEPWAYDLRTGKPKTRIHPITGLQTRWQMARPGHHCGCIAAAPNCLFFRSWSTAYYDLISDYGIGHYGGQRPGCWINFLPANGLVLIPEASSGCVCPFAIHCTVVLHPRKVNRVWGMYSAEGPMTPVKRLAINLGAPGDRKNADGALWLSYPRPQRGRLVMDFDLNDEIQAGGQYYRQNAEGWSLDNVANPWIFSSGCRGLTQCAVPLLGKDDPSRAYRVRLAFAEPDDNVKPGQRVFNVTIQGREVLTNFDIVREANGPHQPIVKQFKGIHIEDNLKITLSPSPSASVPSPVLCGIEITAE